MNKTVFQVIGTIRAYKLLSLYKISAVFFLLLTVIFLDLVTLNFVRTTFSEIKSDPGSSLQSISVLFLVIAVKAGLSIFNYFHITKISHIMLAELRKILFQRFFDLNEVRGFSSGWLIELLQRHSGIFSIHFFQSCMRAIVDIFVILALIGYTFYLYPFVVLPLVFSIVVPICIWIAFTRKTLVGLAEASNKANLGITNVATNLLESRDEVRVNGLPNLAIEFVSDSGRELTRAQSVTAALMNTPKHLWEVCLVVFGILFLFLVQGNSEGAKELGLVSVTLGAIMVRVIPLLNSLTVNINQIRHSRPSIKIILDMLSMDKEKPELQISSVNTDTSPKIYTEEKQLAVVEVSEGNSLKVNGSVQKLKDKAKKFVLIKGGSGRGKTSLIRGLVGLKDVKFFHPLLNSLFEEISTSRVRWSAQETVLFDTTIASNVRLYDHIRDILGPMGKIGLMDHSAGVDFVDRTINASNNEISSGQKRRLGVLRAVESGAEWVVLDEPEVGMDHDTKQSLENYISTHVTHQNFVVISHSSIFDKFATICVELT